ncbi:MAG TPA: MG2 domain-containing protein, partial [Verrucomicrobium sp.]|nr:MG2 domain-containing protein [Verrucomicrobium sp.]
QEVDPENPWVRVDEDCHSRRFILVTDLGLLVKRNADGSREVFVQSIQRGEPVDNAKVIVLAKNGEFITEGVTTGGGHLHLDSVEHLKREKTPVAIIARLGNDVAFIPFDRPDRLVDFSRFDTEGVLASQKETLDAFVFTERGVYRPGDAVHVSGIVRRRDWSGALDGLPVKLLLFDAKGNQTAEENLPLPEDGFFDMELPTDESDPTGTYQARLYLMQGENEDKKLLLGRTTFRLEDFQPDRMKLALTFNTEAGLGWVQPREVVASLNLQSLFGFAAADRTLKAKLELNPAWFSFDKFPDYTFHNWAKSNLNEDDAEEGSDAAKVVELGEKTTDANGNAVFNLALERFAEGSFFLNFLAEGFEKDGGRSVRTAQSMLVSPLTFVVGYKADGDLQYVGKDAERHLKIIALAPNLAQIAQPGLKQRIVEMRHLSVLTKQPNGSYAYESTTRDKVVSEAEFTLPADGADVLLPTQKAGEYRYELVDAESHVVCLCPFTVVGKGDSERSLDRNAELDLKLAKGSWNSGENLELSINAPYTGAGLITIERENVLGWQWFKSPTTGSTQHIPVPEGVEGNAYVNVSFVRALDSKEIFMSPLSYAVQSFTANPDQRKLAVEVDAPPLVKPNQELKIGFKTAKPSRIVVYAVDEGITQITAYKLPQPLPHFMRKRSLEVETSQLMDLILPEFSLLAQSSAFGGDEGTKIKMHLNPFKRRKEPPVVFWSGIVEAGPERKEVSYTVPDYFAGRLKIMAVAVSQDGMGTAETASTVRGPFVLSPNVPVFAAPGDEFTASLTVANNLEGAAAATAISISAEGDGHLELVDGASRSLEVPVGAEGTARFRVRVKDELGGAELVFKASGGTEAMERRATLSVRPAAPHLTEVQSGYFRLSKQDVPVKRTVYPQYRKNEASASVLPMGLARGLEAYVAGYPHGCSEQITSKAVSRLLVSTEVDFGFDKAEAVKQLDGAFGLLQSRQNNNGGFGYWNDSCHGGFDFLSIYVSQFLTEAKDSGFAVPATLLDGAKNRLLQMAKGKPSGLGETALQAAAIYLLTRQGEMTTNYVLNLRDTLE